mmetsp:Transcript_23206/g.44197  ORF Transcript_23206/g.44197 Transcript_23206/m.44197 type:complete len:91 (-) Transcript_23206:95-367(-)
MTELYEQTKNKHRVTERPEDDQQEQNRKVNIRDRTTTKTKEHGNPVQVDSEALLHAGVHDEKDKKLREKTAHIGQKTQDPKWKGVEKIEA